jgi:AcrR family transcriptional regulator
MNEYRRSAPAAAAAERIVEAALAELVQLGAGAMAMREVAERAGVSKGLIHYHYRDKDALLVHVAARLGERVAARAHGALRDVVAADAVDALRHWLEREIMLGEWRGLMALADWPAPEVRITARRALAARRGEVRELIERACRLLAVRPRIASTAVGDLVIAAVSGLVAETGAGSAPDPGEATDVLVLALLGLGA